MRRFFAGLVLIVGVALIAAGGWWIWTQRTQIRTSESKPLQETQEIGIERNSIDGSVIISTEHGLQIMNVATGELADLGGSFRKIPQTVQRLVTAPDGTYWILITASSSDTERHYYLVDWKNKKLQIFDDILKKKGIDTALISQIEISDGSTVLVVSTSSEGADTSGSNRPYKLATISLESGKYQDFGTVFTTDLALLSYDVSTNEIIFAHRNTDIRSVSGKRYNSTQNYERIADAQPYILTPHSNYLLKTSGDSLELISLFTQDKTATLAPKTDFYFEPVSFWAKSSAVLATVEYNNATIAKKNVSFHSSTGGTIYTIQVNGSQTVLLSENGQSAVIVSQDTDAGTSTTQVVYRYIRPYDGTTQIFSNIPANSTILGVF